MLARLMKKLATLLLRLAENGSEVSQLTAANSSVATPEDPELELGYGDPYGT